MQFFRKKAKQGQKRVRFLKNWAKMYKTLKYFGKGQPHAFDHWMHEKARICPAITWVAADLQMLLICRLKFS